MLNDKVERNDIERKYVRTEDLKRMWQDIVTGEG